MITYIDSAHEEGVARRRLDDAWLAFREAVDEAYEAHCQEKDFKSVVLSDAAFGEPQRTIKQLQDALTEYYERLDAAANADYEGDYHECDTGCAKECALEELAETQYQDWKDNAA